MKQKMTVQKQFKHESSLLAAADATLRRVASFHLVKRIKRLPRKGMSAATMQQLFGVGIEG